MPTTDVVLRTLEPSQLEIAIALRAQMIREIDECDPDLEYPGWRDRFRSYFSARMAQATCAIFGAECEGQFVGLSSVYMLTNHRTEIFLRPVAYITNVFVMPEKRRRGLATALTQHCIDWARLQGCGVIRLRTSRMGRPVYERMGFTPSDELELRYD